MKKIYKLMTFIIFIFSSMLIFFACGEPKLLNKPLTVGVVNNEIFNETTGELEKNQILLVTDNNKYASGYKFYITDNSDKENLNNYATFTSSTNSIDITNYFNPRKVYHYFVQYLGGNNYKTSDFSDIKTYTPQAEAIEKPYAQLLGEKLSWFRIMNAEGYAVYEEVIDKDNNSNKELLVTTNSETFELDLSNRFTNFESPYNTYKYTIKALASGFYNNSQESNCVTYIKDISLSTPKNLNIKEENGEYYLNWNSVSYATKYEIVINGKTANPIFATENKLKITEYLTNYSTFSFNVKAKESDVLSYSESEYSESLTYDYTTKLSVPQNIQVTRDGQYLNITWDQVNMAESYSLIIEENGVEKYSATSLEVTNATIEIATYFGEIINNKEIIIKVKANAVNQYIFESDFTQLNYIIYSNTNN